MVESEEGQDVGAVVLGQRPDERLDDEQRRDGEDEPGDDALGASQADLTGLAEGQPGSLL